MTDSATAKRLERAHKAAGNVPVRCWVPATRKPEVDAMAKEADEIVSEGDK